MNIRVGLGFDVHPLKENRDFWLGGIKIPHVKGAEGHSDADALIHSICDALLGAANLGDIGIHFPNTDAKWKNIDSKVLLKHVVILIEKEGFKIGNIDSTICLQAPKISPFIPSMKEVLAETMRVPEQDISIKATTTERLGYIGREEGVSAYSVALIYKS